MREYFCPANIVSVLHQARLNLRDCFWEQSCILWYSCSSRISNSVIGPNVQTVTWPATEPEKLHASFYIAAVTTHCSVIIKTLNLMNVIWCCGHVVYVLKKIPQHAAPVCGSVHSGKSPVGREGVWTSDPGQRWQMQHWWDAAPGHISPVNDNSSAHVQ